MSDKIKKIASTLRRILDVDLSSKLTLPRYAFEGWVKELEQAEDEEPKLPPCKKCEGNGWDGRCPECGRFTTDETPQQIHKGLLQFYNEHLGCSSKEEEPIRQVHTVQIVYSSPTGYSEDRYTTVAVFSSEERARLFVEWAESQRKRICNEYHLLTEEEREKEVMLHERLGVPSVLLLALPESDYGTDHYHFQYDDEFDLDPVFG